MIFARPLFRLVLLTLLAIMGPVGVAGAAAMAPVTASGTFAYSGVPVSCHPDGTDTICTYADTVVAYTGTFNGVGHMHNILIIHADGSANFHGVEIFTGTVSGEAGTVTIEAHGAGTSTLLFHATNSIVSGTGALAHLHGVLKQVGTVGNLGPLGTYTGQIHFDDR